MLTRTQTSYRLWVVRDRKAMEFSQTDYQSVVDARVAARRLGEYAEIRQRTVVVKSRLVERVEQAA